MADLRRLGVRAGGVTMVHTRMSALGWVIGGSETVVRSLLEALGPEGTLMAYASWADHVYALEDWPEEHREAYRAEPPAFDLATAEVDRDYGRIPERVRTWPGAARSAHPEASVVAVGPRASWLTAEHAGRVRGGQPVRAARRGGRAGPDAGRAAGDGHAAAPRGGDRRAPGKRRVTFEIAIADGTTQSFTDIDTSHGAYPYELLGLETDEFEVIAREALAEGVGVRGRVGEAECHLFPARELTAFGVAWIEARFGLNVNCAGWGSW